MSLTHVPATNGSLSEIGKVSLPIAVAEAIRGLWVANDRVQVLLQVCGGSMVTALPKDDKSLYTCQGRLDAEP